MRNTVTLESLLATHDQPFVVIDRSLTIVAVNRSYQDRFSIATQDLIGKPCCAVLDPSRSNAEPRCRHQGFFGNIEPYAEVHGQDDENGGMSSLRVRGYPLVDGNGVMYLGESVSHSVLSSGKPNNKMVGQSAAFSNLATQLGKAAGTDAAVMLTGETGTGKELAAEYVHSNSERCSKELVIVDCTVLGENLFESELFGHDKGAFTGASGAKKGLFHLADGGTLFLDEIGDLPLSQQPKLLRALESGTFRRVGSTQTLQSDVRVVCATHRDLARLVASGDFREDLFYRLSVFPIGLPPLRERPEDIPLLAKSILSVIGHSRGTDFRLSNRAMEHLSKYSFPGNIRELRNSLQLASALSQDGLIDIDDIHLRDEKRSANPETNVVDFEPSVKVEDSSVNPLEDVEVRYIRFLLDKHQGNRKKVAYEMNISERTLYRKLKRFNINQNQVAAGWI